MNKSSILHLKQGAYLIDKQNPDLCLGKGSFGKVYKGFDTRKNIHVALKQINIQLLEQFDEEIKQVILNQINVMRKFTNNMNQIPCQYLVKQFDCFRTQKFIYIVMEYCPNGTLLNELNAKKTFLESQVIQIARQLLQGLAYLEKLDIAHRDLKPQNIFVSLIQDQNKKVYKIGDFGFAAKKKSFNEVLGTYQYMAPEIFKRQQYTTKVDVWSLGITLHQLLFNQLYYSGKNKWEIEEAIDSKDYKLSEEQSSKISKKMQNLLELCLNKNKFLRPFASELLKHPVFTASVQQPSVFILLKSVVQRCLKLIKMAQTFDKYEKSSLITRKTIFIQLYLLKFAYCEMNRTSYSIMNKQNHLNLPQEKFIQLIDINNQKQFQELNQMSQKIWNQSFQLYKSKYKQFVEQYLPKFTTHDRQLIQKVINDQPYEDPVHQIFVNQLKKWSIQLKISKTNQDFIKLNEECNKIINAFEQAS